MFFLSITLTLFLILEFFNVLALYFNPTLKQANSVGVFKAWENSKLYPDIHNLLKYLVYWVAGTKAIFLALIVAILVYGSSSLKIVSCIALIVSISLFYWKMFPLLKTMDYNGELEPKGYSKTLALMIAIIVSFLLIGVLGVVLIEYVSN